MAIKKTPIEHLISAVILTLLFSACSQNGTKNTLPEKTYNNAMKIALVSQSQKERPAWLDSPPEKSAKYHYLVGLSNSYVSEKAARKDALHDARINYARYTGIDVKEVNRMFSATYGTEANIFNPTHSMMSNNTETVNAHIHRVKAKHWYWEKFSSTNNVETKYAYKYWVLVAVPLDEYDRVQAWKAAQKKQVKEKEEMTFKRANKLSEFALSNHKKNSLNVVQTLKMKRPIEALKLSKSDWVQLYNAKKKISDMLANAEVFLTKINQAQWDTLNTMIKIRNSIVIDVGRFNPYLLESDSQFIPVWAWMKVDNQYEPISDLMLKFVNSNAVTIATAKTNHRGKAVFKVKRPKVGSHAIEIDTSRWSSTSINAQLTNTLKPLSVDVEFIQKPADIDSQLSAMLFQLFEEPTYGDNKTQFVYLSASVNDTSKISNRIIKLLKTKLLAFDDLVVLRDAPGAKQIASDFSPNASHIEVETSPTTAGGFTLTMEHYRVNSHQLLASVSDTVRIQNNNIVPDKVQDIATITPLDRSISLEITSRYGDRQTYTDGDRLSYYLSTDVDAYLLMIYEDATGNFTQLIPNQNSGSNFHKAEAYFEIPPSSSEYQFIVTAPYGEETLWVYSSAQPFPQLSGTLLPNGLVSLDDAPFAQINAFMKHIKNKNLAHGEAKTTIITMPKMYTSNL